MTTVKETQLKKLIYLYGLKQKAIREMIDEEWGIKLTGPTFSRIVNGQRNPSPEERRAISQALKTPQKKLWPEIENPNL